MILDAGFDSSLAVWIWATVLTSSLISVVGFARAGSVVFWKAKSVTPDPEVERGVAPSSLSYVAVGGLIVLLIAHTAFAGPAYRYVENTAAQLFAPEPYVSTVLDTPGKLSKPANKEDH